MGQDPEDRTEWVTHGHGAGECLHWAVGAREDSGLHSSMARAQPGELSPRDMKLARRRTEGVSRCWDEGRARSEPRQGQAEVNGKECYQPSVVALAFNSGRCRGRWSSVSLVYAVSSNTAKAV